MHTFNMGLTHHNHIDFSCELDAENIPYGAAHYIESMKAALENSSIEWLTLHYPEFEFKIVSFGLFSNIPIFIGHLK